MPRPLRQISVLVPAHNAALDLPETLDAVLSCKRPPGVAVEIVVSDDGSDDDTLHIARRYGPAVRCLRSDRRSGPSVARNTAATNSAGDVLVFLDSGDRPIENFITQIAYLFRDDRVGVASWPATVREVTRDVEVTWWPRPVGSTRVLALAGCFAVRRELFDAVGGYDDALRCGENSDLCDRLVEMCRARGRTVVTGDQIGVQLTLGQPPAYYDHFRVEAAEHLLRRDADRLAADARARGHIHALAAVNAARCEDWERARRHAWNALRAVPINARSWARLAVSLVPPLARRLWAAENRRSRVAAADSPRVRAIRRGAAAGPRAQGDGAAP